VSLLGLAFIYNTIDWPTVIDNDWSFDYPVNRTDGPSFLTAFVIVRLTVQSDSQCFHESVLCLLGQNGRECDVACSESIKYVRVISHRMVEIEILQSRNVMMSYVTDIDH
jgi:hypothetical protein